MMQVTITHAEIVRQNQDTVVLYSTVPSPYAVEPQLLLQFTTPLGGGERFLQQHFAEVPLRQITDVGAVRGKLPKFSQAGGQGYG